VRVSLKEIIDGFRIDLSDLIERSNGHSCSELVRLITERRERLILRLCGPKYSRSYPYRREGSYWKPLITSIGTIRFRVEKVVQREDGDMFSPILEALDVPALYEANEKEYKLVK